MGAGPPPLFLEQTKARWAEKMFLETAPPPPPAPLSKCLHDRDPSHTRSILIVKYSSTRFCAKFKQPSLIMVLIETLRPLYYCQHKGLSISRPFVVAS